GRLRRGRAIFDYVVAGFRTSNQDAIIFISSGTVANRAYFANVGDTRRQGIEVGLSGRYRGGSGAAGLWSWGINYALLAATFQTPFSALSATHPDAVGGAIEVAGGARIPSVPRHVGKLGLRWASRSGLSVGATALVGSSQYLRGDEANLLAPVPGYVVVGARAAYQIVPAVGVFAALDNLFDR